MQFENNIDEKKHSKRYLKAKEEQKKRTAELLERCDNLFEGQRDCRIEIMLKETEKNILEQKAKAYGMAVDEYIRYISIYK